MCGITALFRYTNINENDLDSLALMNKEMAYRGPNEQGVWNNDKCGLAHTRLSIIGLENGKQPLFNEDKSLVLICNGEIYNYIELRKELENKGHVFFSDSDSETIIHLYEEYGVKCLNHLRGMFAFCLYDVNKKHLFSARDRVGEKTLYYAQIQTGIVFSTELKAILKHFIEKPQLNAKALAESVRHNYPLDLKNTYIEQIKRLQAGEYAIVDDKGLEIFKYWEKDITPTFKGTVEKARTETLRLMRESVDLCLRSDVPVAVLLSGGIDSSAIAALAKETGREVHVITAGYKGNYNCDERDVAKRFAKEKGLIYHEVELDANNFSELFDEYIDYIDEPVCDVSSMSQWALYKKAKELGFTVLLSGIGGDELFYGYPSQNKMAEALSISKQHKDIFPWKGIDKKMEYIRFMSKNLKSVLFAGYPNKIDDSWPVTWTYDDYQKFSENANINFNNQTFDLSKIDVHHSFPTNANIDTVYEFTFTRFMNTLCLYLADRLGMGNSIEIRCPLLDYKIVEFASSLPSEMKFKTNNPKYFLKETLRSIVPDYILDAKKRGFEPPFDFINEMNKRYTYKKTFSNHVFYNSMLADSLLSRLEKNRFI